jgi:hypothetical protein
MIGIPIIGKKRLKTMEASPARLGVHGGDKA